MRVPTPTSFAEFVSNCFPVLRYDARPSFDSEMADARMNSEFTASFPRRAFGNGGRHATDPIADGALEAPA
jgi:hypothetical protein